MPWPRKQAIAIMLKARRSGDTALANKAKRYIGKRKDTAMSRMKRK